MSIVDLECGFSKHLCMLYVYLHIHICQYLRTIMYKALGGIKS